MAVKIPTRQPQFGGAQFRADARARNAGAVAQARAGQRAMPAYRKGGLVKKPARKKK